MDDALREGDGHAMVAEQVPQAAQALLGEQDPTLEFAVYDVEEGEYPVDIDEVDAYLITGSKTFISGAGSTDVLVLMTRTGAPDSGAGGITAFAIPADLPGIDYGKNEIKMGWNSQPTRTITFEDVRVPEKYRLGAEGEGFKIAMKGLDGGRINIGHLGPYHFCRYYWLCRSREY